MPFDVNELGNNAGWATKLYIKSINDDTLNNKAVESTADGVIELFTLIFPTLWIVIFLYHIVQNNLKKDAWMLPDMGVTVRMIVLAALFYSYTPVAGGLSKLLDRLNMAAVSQFEATTSAHHAVAWGDVINTSPYQFTDDEKEELETVADASDEVKKEKIKEILEDREGWFNFDVDYLARTIMNIPNLIITELFMVLGDIVKFVMIMLIYGVDKILFAIGPLAILFSLFPLWKEKAYTWLGTWIVTKLSFLSIVIIDNIVSNMIANTNAAMLVDGLAGNTYLTMGMSIVSTVLYILSFWLTSRYIGSGEAGRVLSTVGAVTAMAATKAMRGGGGGGGGGNTGPVSKLAQTGGNIAAKALKTEK